MAVMAFVDGENLVARYQAMVGEGRKPRSTVAYREDVFAWPNEFLKFPHVIENLRRVNYYISLIGSDETIDEVKEELKELSFRDGATPYTYTVTPHVFKRIRGEKRSRLVDIQMTIDILNHVYARHIDEIILISGDADFVPLVEAEKRAGARVEICALTSGLATRLQVAADRFMSLDEFFFVP